MPGLPYRCATCESEPRRCQPCRERRAAATRRARAARVAEGTCTECAADALPDRTRCQRHADLNNARSGAAHAAARKQG